MLLLAVVGAVFQLQHVFSNRRLLLQATHLAVLVLVLVFRQRSHVVVVVWVLLPFHFRPILGCLPILLLFRQRRLLLLVVAAADEDDAYDVVVRPVFLPAHLRHSIARIGEGKRRRRQRRRKARRKRLKKKTKERQRKKKQEEKEEEEDDAHDEKQRMMEADGAGSQGSAGERRWHPHGKICVIE